MPAHPYCSFLLRCWHPGSDMERIEIEHIHSGDRTVVTSFGAAVDWMRACSEELPTRPGQSSTQHPDGAHAREIGSEI